LLAIWLLLARPPRACRDPGRGRSLRSTFGTMTDRRNQWVVGVACVVFSTLVLNNRIFAPSSTQTHTHTAYTLSRPCHLRIPYVHMPHHAPPNAHVHTQFRYVNALTTAGVRTAFELVPGAGHMTFLLSLMSGDALPHTLEQWLVEAHA
jgi:hypothetical protein